jgi:hypothetical protein
MEVKIYSDASAGPFRHLDRYSDSCAQFLKLKGHKTGKMYVDLKYTHVLMLSLFSNILYSGA